MSPKSLRYENLPILQMEVLTLSSIPKLLPVTNYLVLSCSGTVSPASKFRESNLMKSVRVQKQS